MSIATIDIQPRVEDVAIKDDRLTVSARDGRIVSVPLSWYPRLLGANDRERRAWRVFEDSEERDIIFWEDLDELIPLVALFAGVPSRESERSLRKWLSDR